MKNKSIRREILLSTVSVSKNRKTVKIKTHKSISMKTFPLVFMKIKNKWLMYGRGNDLNLIEKLKIIWLILKPYGVRISKEKE